MALPSSLTSRIAVLDVLRGICILGILLANIVAFSSPAMAESFGSVIAWSPQEEWLDAFRQWFVAGKFRGMLCVLFGFGMALQYQKFLARRASQEASLQPLEKWPGKYMKRTIFLGLLGAFHGLFIWFGDILFMYSLVAFVAMWIVGASDKALWAWIGGLMGFSLILGIGFALLMTLFPEAAGGSGLGPLGDYLTAERLTQAYQQDGYLVQLLYRVGFFVMSVLNAFFIIPPLLALFLYGVWLQRTGVLTAPSQHRSTVAMVVVFGLLAFLLNGVGVLVQATGVEFETSELIELGLSPLWAGALIVILAWLFEKSSLFFVWQPLGKVGRIALTSYLSQSVICTAVFYSWGGGLYGRLDQFEVLWVVAAVWAFNIVFAYAWLRKFDIGPVEWAWRSAVEGRKLPWRKSVDASVPPPVVAG